MKPLNIVTDALTLPARTAGHVAAATLGATVGAATVGLRATGRAVGRALDRVTGTPHPAASPWPTDTTTVVSHGPAKKKAPSKKAAVLAPALGVPETDVLDGTADLDPS